MHADELSGEVIEAAIAIHRELGPGLLESVYEALLARVLTERGRKIRRQHPIRLKYGDLVFEEAFRADLIVEDSVIVEVKAVTKLEPVFGRQLLTYLRLANMPVGLIVNFGGETLVSGVKRVVNSAPAFAESRVRKNTGADTPHKS